MSPPRHEVVMLCGNKYAFRSVYMPILRTLAETAAIRVVILNYPEAYNLRTTLESLRGDGWVTDYDLVPTLRAGHGYYRTVGRLCRLIRRQAPRGLLVDEDSSPMAQLVIQAGRDVDSRVIGVQKEVPTRLLAAYDTARAASGLTISEAYRRASVAAGEMAVGSVPERRRSWRLLTSWVPAGLRRGRQVRAQYWWLPLWYAGRVLHPTHDELTGVVAQCACLRVDATLVYSQHIARTLRHFFPRLNVLVVRHPLLDNCRCNGGERKSGLLVALGAPLYQCVRPDNPAEAVERRWEQVIARAVALNNFANVAIRPHPRETDRYPYRLAERLCSRGISTVVLNPWSQSLREVICDYAGVVGAPSGSLGEASFSCRRAFVVAVEAIERASFVRRVPYYTDGVVQRPDGDALQLEDFVKRPPRDEGGATVAETIRQLLSE